MEITPELIRELCVLSRLEVSEAALPKWQSDLQKMVAFVEQLQRVDTSGVEPLVHMGAAVQVLREDLVQGSVSQHEALNQAAGAMPPYFSVPKVISSPVRSTNDN
ncbi:MAG: Asp-tRNA(Asn)/Glu-tRNA(Gln) amidotransferase subunit GatC [Bacteroidota bacterium]